MVRYMGCLVLVACFALVGVAHASMIGMERVEINFCKEPEKARKKLTWSPAKKLTMTAKGLGWDGQSRSSWDGWIQSVPIAIGVAWRPARSVSLQVTISPVPAVVKLPNGQKYTPLGGQVFARFSPDKKYWSTWQSLGAPSVGKVLLFKGQLSVPRKASTRYNKLLQVYSRRKDIPWRSDEDALVRLLIKKNPHFFRNYKPFIGYVQILWEGSFRGGQRLKSFDIRAVYVVSGLHYPPSKMHSSKRHNGPWRFVHPSIKK